MEARVHRICKWNSRSSLSMTVKFTLTPGCGISHGWDLIGSGRCPVSWKIPGVYHIFGVKYLTPVNYLSNSTLHTLHKVWSLLFSLGDS